MNTRQLEKLCRWLHLGTPVGNPQPTGCTTRFRQASGGMREGFISHFFKSAFSETQLDRNKRECQEMWPGATSPQMCISLRIPWAGPQNEKWLGLFLVSAATSRFVRLIRGTLSCSARRALSWISSHRNQHLPRKRQPSRCSHQRSRTRPPRRKRLVLVWSALAIVLLVGVSQGLYLVIAHAQRPHAPTTGVRLTPTAIKTLAQRWRVVSSPTVGKDTTLLSHVTASSSDVMPGRSGPTALPANRTSLARPCCCTGMGRDGRPLPSPPL